MLCGVGLASIAVILNVSGFVVSTFQSKSGEASLFPTASVDSNTIECGPSAKSETGFTVEHTTKPAPSKLHVVDVTPLPVFPSKSSLVSNVNVMEVDVVKKVGLFVTGFSPPSTAEMLIVSGTWVSTFHRNNSEASLLSTLSTDSNTIDCNPSGNVVEAVSPDEQVTNPALFKLHSV